LAAYKYKVSLFQRIMPDAYKDVVILSTNESKQYADSVYSFLTGKLEDQGREIHAPVHIALRVFPDKEKRPRVVDNIRGLQAYYIHNCIGDDGEFHPDVGLMKAGLAGYAIRNARVAKLIYVIPYFPYQRGDRMDIPRVPISAKFALELLEIPKSDIPISLITFDMHTSQAAGFVDYPIENLPTASLLLDYFKDMNPSKYAIVGISRDSDRDRHLVDERTVRDFNEDYRQREAVPELTVVSPDTSGAARARYYAKQLGVPLALIDKRRDGPGMNEVMNIVGREYINGRIAVEVDDMIDTAGTMTKGADALFEEGAVGIFGAAAHGLFSTPKGSNITTPDKIRKSGMKILVTDSVPRPQKFADDNSDWLLPRRRTGPLIGEIIYRMHGKRSISALYSDGTKPTDDDDVPLITQ
jgi:ribose-phosphate pyrophosphokinase